VRRATEPDPTAPHLAGTAELREHLQPQEAFRAFILVARGPGSSLRQLSFKAESEFYAELVYEGMTLLILDEKTRSERVV
jgi:hypothetical protein